jgi:hypothetical protein
VSLCGEDEVVRDLDELWPGMVVEAGTERVCIEYRCEEA